MKNKLTGAAIPAPSFEKENDCLSCGNFIAHPLCPCCVAKGFRQWIRNFPDKEKEIQKNLNKFLKDHHYLDGSSKRCISCSEEKTYLCPYCFTDYLYRIIKEAGAGPRALTEFLFIFNFDFSHEGYYSELESLGGY